MSRLFYISSTLATRNPSPCRARQLWRVVEGYLLSPIATLRVLCYNIEIKKRCGYTRRIGMSYSTVEKKLKQIPEAYLDEVSVQD